jgi:hypothetical protein
MLHKGSGLRRTLSLRLRRIQSSGGKQCRLGFHRFCRAMCARQTPTRDAGGGASNLVCSVLSSFVAWLKWRVSDRGGARGGLSCRARCLRGLTGGRRESFLSMAGHSVNCPSGPRSILTGYFVHGRFVVSILGSLLDPSARFRIVVARHRRDATVPVEPKETE